MTFWLAKLRSSIHTSPLKKRILSGAFWVTAANVSSRGMMMLAMILSARILGKSNFGELGIIQASITMFEAVAGLGIGITAVKHIAEYRKRDNEKVSRIISLSNIMTLVSGVFIGISIYFLAPWMSTALLGQSYLTEALRIGALILLLNTVGASQAGILTGFEAYRSIAFVNSIVGLLTVPLVAGGAYYYGVIGALWGMVGVSFMICVLYLIKVNSIMLRESIPRGKRPTHKESRLLLSFSLPAMLMGIMIGPVNWIGGTALVKMYGFSQMGLYSAANQWFSTLLFLPGVLTVVFLPIFSGSSGNESRNFQSIVTIGVKSTLLASLPLVCVVALASHLIMGFYGKEYQDAYPLLVVISFTAAVASTQNMFGNALAAVNRMWVNFFSNLLWASVYLGCAYALLLSGYGAIALCWASLAAYVFKLFFTVFFVVRIITNNNANKI